MKLNIPVAAIVSIILLSSCSSMYRTGQTPDDVYYSPTRPGADVVKTNKNNSQDEYAYTNPDDNYLRMKVQNPNRWNAINDADYWYSYNRPYQSYTDYNYFNSYNSGFNTYYGINSFGGYPFWNSYGYGNYGYSNYYGNSGYYGHGGYYPGVVVIRTLRSNTGPKPYMGGYTNNTYNNTNNVNSGRNNSSGLGRLIRSTVGGNENRSEPTYNTPSRTFTPSVPTQSSSSSSNSSSGRSSTGSSSSGGRSGRGGN